MPIRAAALKEITSHCLSLVDLNLAMCGDIDDDGCRFIAHCTQLKKLNLTCSCIKDEGFSVLAGRLKNIEELNLNYCFGLTDVGIRQALQCQKLRKLSLEDVHIQRNTLQDLEKRDIAVEIGLASL